jgi:hypothetical protein
MAEIKLQTAYRVDIIESERGWGSKVDEVKYFETEQEAKAYCTKYNAQNTATTVPDWYMRADYVGRVR